MEKFTFSVDQVENQRFFFLVWQKLFSCIEISTSYDIWIHLILKIMI